MTVHPADPHITCPFNSKLCCKEKFYHKSQSMFQAVRGADQLGFYLEGLKGALLAKVFRKFSCWPISGELHSEAQVTVEFR